MRFIILIILLIPLSAFARYADDSMSYQTKTEESYTLPQTDTDTPKQTDKQETPPDIEIDNLKANGVIKTEKGLCIKGDCKNNWPTLKCANFDSRPAGESGDDFCQSTGKTCFAVSVGSGASFFGECSTPPASAHKTRCCWVE